MKTEQKIKNPPHQKGPGEIMSNIFHAGTRLEYIWHVFLFVFEKPSEPVVVATIIREETMSSIFFLTPDELVGLYAAHKRGKIKLADEDEVALVEELLSRPPSGPVAWELLELMREG
jgi:hypothetical protein